MKRWPSQFGAAMLAAAVLWGLAGCGPSGPSHAVPGSEAGSGAWREELFTFAIDNLNRLEEFAPGEMLPHVVERLNQWIAAQDSPSDWQPDPIVRSLPASLAAMDAMKRLDRMDFSDADGEYLQQSVWMRDVAGWARGNELDDVARAGRLFDWTVRNIQLEPAVGADGKPTERVPVMPWQTLLSGRGTAIERAWVFLLLARQQGLEAAMLGVPADGKSGTAAPWAIGVLSQGEVYLFDPLLGLPIPSSKASKTPPAMPLKIAPATLWQVKADPSLLARLDSPGRPYPVKAAQLAHVVAMVEASAESLSRRMKIIESRLAGKQKVVLAASPTAAVALWRKVRGVSEAGLWLYPLETVFRSGRFPSDVERYRQWLMEPFLAGSATGLWKGRLLHLRGVLGGEGGATACYQQARPSNAEVQEAGNVLAQHYYKKGQETSPGQPAEQAKQLAADRAQAHAVLIFRAKYDASYWLGLVAFERGNWASAADYFSQRTLKAVPDGLWSPGARYNLGRTHEASGDRQQAVKQYEEGAKLDGDVGQKVRAGWLK